MILENCNKTNVTIVTASVTVFAYEWDLSSHGGVMVMQGSMMLNP